MKRQKQECTATQLAVSDCTWAQWCFQLKADVSTVTWQQWKCQWWKKYSDHLLKWKHEYSNTQLQLAVWTLTLPIILRKNIHSLSWFVFKLGTGIKTWSVIFRTHDRSVLCLMCFMCLYLSFCYLLSVSNLMLAVVTGVNTATNTTQSSLFSACFSNP